ncbi:ABC transporter substrate-binding protein [Salinisphaera sp. USBA-960]|uniref:ABC transporter substrate-binding protein n=1 Tax=Salinisphaera orenii TaxID=856731 RepID=UPI000DBE716A|nr:ABC transporter substrate-binding protein [Salifodinibacter halophilus]NNC26090.1 ABC transporter substrate-binding protein [Salifodinibacter halophilus]
MTYFSRQFLYVSMATCLLLAGYASSGMAATKPVKFAEPSWPGVNVKTEIAEQLLDTLGYQSETTRLNLPFIYRGLAKGSVDVFLGAWLPPQKDMLEPPLKKGKIVKLGANLTDATQGLAVPAYIWEKGIHTIKDLTDHAAEFDHKIYGIESGSAMNQAFNEAIQNDYKGMGGWTVVASSTAAMVTQVKRSVKRQNPVVFYGWKPHWMNVTLDIRYLKDGDSSDIAGITARVLTLANAEFSEQRPNVARLLRQLHVDAAIQSSWINKYGHKKNKKTKVAQQWLANHGDTVTQWLKGVKTADGGSAVAAYQKRYQ